MAIPRKPEDAVLEDMTGRTIGPIQAPTAAEDRTMVPVPLRLGKTRLEALRRHFETKGLNLSSGIRTVLYEYMAREHVKL